MRKANVFVASVYIQHASVTYAYMYMHAYVNYNLGLLVTLYIGPIYVYQIAFVALLCVRVTCLDIIQSYI